MLPVMLTVMGAKINQVKPVNPSLEDPITVPFWRETTAVPSPNYLFPTLRLNNHQHFQKQERILFETLEQNKR